MKMLRVFAVLSLSLIAVSCNTVGNLGYRTIEVKGSSIGIQFMPRQITRLLEDNGYQRKEVTEYIPEYGDADNVRTRETGMLIDSGVDFRMVFQSNDLPELLVAVRIMKSNGRINIGISEQGSKQLSAAGTRKRDQIAALLGNLYGPENVKVRG